MVGLISHKKRLTIQNGISNMTRKEEIEQAAEEYYNKVKYLSDLSALPITTFKAGAEWADKTMLDNVCDFIKINAYKYGKVKFVDDRAIFDFRTDRFIEDLRKAMEGGETS